MIYLLTLRRLRNCQGFDFSDLQCRQKQFVEIVLAFQCRGVFSSAVGAALDFGIKFFPCHGKIHFVDCIAPVAADGTEGADRVWIVPGLQICFFCQAIRKIPEHFFAPGSPDLFCCAAFPLLCNYNFVRICCEYSFFLLVSDEYFYFQFGMCTFYGYFHCIAVFHCFYSEYIVSVDIRNFCLGCVF